MTPAGKRLVADIAALPRPPEWPESRDAEWQTYRRALRQHVESGVVLAEREREQQLIAAGEVDETS